MYRHWTGHEEGRVPLAVLGAGLAEAARVALELAWEAVELVLGGVGEAAAQGLREQRREEEQMGEAERHRERREDR
jgi:hypothetical protein